MQHLNFYKRSIEVPDRITILCYCNTISIRCNIIVIHYYQTTLGAVIKYILLKYEKCIIKHFFSKYVICIPFMSNPVNLFT